MLASTSSVARDNGSLSNKLGSFAIALDKREFRLISENVSLRRSERLLALKRSRPSRRRLVSSGMEVIVMSEFAAARGGASGFLAALLALLGRYVDAARRAYVVNRPHEGARSCDER